MTAELSEQTPAADASHLIVESSSDDFPALLSGIPDAPDRLFVRGNVDALHMPALAIVGSRNPTEQGRRDAFEFARHLGGAGFCIGASRSSDPTAGFEEVLSANCIV